ncbi:NlpC/P60 family protein [Actinomadura hibisca]|uniref:NlpC/P60 family protein n=1 Tax=Actinomadura hibisca TaxID=68565 RepID=UPI000ADA5ADB|nr:NlpC/P60 family protein [Actinomadura hibisca]
MFPSPSTTAGRRSGSRPARRLVALSSGAALTLTLLVPAASARPAAEPAPSAQDVKESERRVQDRAAEVGKVKAMLARADGELERLGVAAASAVERYNGELVKLERARGTYQETQRRAAEAQRRFQEAQAELAAFAADAYQAGTGYNSWAATVAGQGGPQGSMDRAGLLEMLAQRRAGIAEHVKAARTVAELFRKQAREAYEEQHAATGRAADAKRAAQDAVAHQREAVQRIEAEKRELEERLGSERARAAALARQRQAALERAEALAAQRNFRGSGRSAALLGSESGRGGTVVRYALKWLGTPYSWGGGTAGGPSYGIEHGSGIYGFDCSGLALYAWSKVGVRLDHWTGTQWTSGPHVPLNQLRAGDLVFFANNTADPDTIHHVGIFIGKGRMVEAPYTGARVRISSIYRNGLIGATRPAG